MICALAAVYYIVASTGPEYMPIKNNGASTDDDP